MSFVRRMFLDMPLCLLLLALPLRADEWPPADPREPMATVAFTPVWASTLRDITTFRQLQAAAGAQGQIAAVVRDGDSPHVEFSWTGANAQGRMRALFYQGGDFGVIITPSGGGNDIILNNFGAFICAACSPPVNACGHRPSWVPHDLHWDVFDCGCTLTGPQSLHAGAC